MTVPTSPVSEAITIFRDAVGWGRETITQRVKLLPSEYQEFLSRIEEDPRLKGCAEGVCYGYNSEHSVLYINTRSKMHNEFIEGLNSIFNNQLPDRRTGAYEFVSGINGSSRELLASSMTVATGRKVVAREMLVMRFWHEDAGFPALMIEINLSQDPRGLDKAVQKHILEFGGNTGHVMGFNLRYEGDKDKESTVSLWRPKFVERSGNEGAKWEVETVIDHRPFRSADGTPVNGTDSIKIPLKSFAPVAIENYPPEVRDCVIEFKFSEFEKLLEKSELGYKTCQEG